MKTRDSILAGILRSMLTVILALSMTALFAQERRIQQENRFVTYTASGQVIDLWLHSHADFEIVSAATSKLSATEIPLLGPAQTAPDVVFLSAEAARSLNDEDRKDLKKLAEQGVPMICECGEYALSQQIGFRPVQLDATEPFEFFVYRERAAGALRASVLPGRTTDSNNLESAGQAGTVWGVDTSHQEVRDQVRAFLLREALRKALEDSKDLRGQLTFMSAVTLPRAGGEGSWTNIADLRREWTHITPDVSCATDPPCWDTSKQANALTVTADFYKIPDGKPTTDYYLINVRSHHDANYQVSYLNTFSGCSDGWVGWYVPGRRLRISLYAGDHASKLYEYGPTGTIKTNTVSYTVGAGLDIGRNPSFNINTSYSVSYSNTDATVYDNSSLLANYGYWDETFIGPDLSTIGVGSVGNPSPNSRGSFFSLRSAIFSTSSPAGGINPTIYYYALFEKDRIDVYDACLRVRSIPHPYVVDAGHTLNVRWNYPPDIPASPRLTIPAGSTAFWTNTPLTVDVPETIDRDGDALSYSVDFGDGAIGDYGTKTQTHSWTKPGPIHLKAKAQDSYAAASDWSESVQFTIKGLDRIEIQGIAEVPEMNEVQFQSQAILSDGSTQMVTTDYPAGWEGGAIRWSVTSPYAMISSTGLFQALKAQGVDRVVTIQATYTLKGIAKATSFPVIVKYTGTVYPPSIRSVVNGASFRPNSSRSAWTTIYGTNLSATARPWRVEEIIGGKLPMTLDGVKVTIGGNEAAISYVSPTQLNVQVPTGVALGPATVSVTTPDGTATSIAQLNEFSPAFFTFDGKYVAAQHADYSYVAKYGLPSAVNASPARPGEVVTLYASGFGPTVPEMPCGEVITTPAPLANPVNVWIGGYAADVQWKGMSGAGLWQLNVRIPWEVPDGDSTVVAEVGGVRTEAQVFVNVVNRVGY